MFLADAIPNMSVETGKCLTNTIKTKSNKNQNCHHMLPRKLSFAIQFSITKF